LPEQPTVVVLEKDITPSATPEVFRPQANNPVVIAPVAKPMTPAAKIKVVRVKPTPNLITVSKPKSAIQTAKVNLAKPINKPKTMFDALLPKPAPLMVQKPKT
jgi:hypothetical protein